VEIKREPWLFGWGVLARLPAQRCFPKETTGVRCVGVECVMGILSRNVKCNMIFK
jgi:hypothetical protein